MKLYIIAGEASGDLHASNLMKAMKAQKPDISIRCWGGDLMQAAGGKLVKHYRDLAFMGFSEVLKNLGTIRKNFQFCREDILSYQPDAVILVDYPGFNLRMAKFIHEQGIKVLYYISPQVWAWNRSRVKKIAKYVDKMFVILPFEKAFFESYGQDVDFVGHPLLDAIGNKQGLTAPDAFRKENDLGEKPLVAILPGSRKQEISRMLPVMLNVTSAFPDQTFVVAGAPSIDESFYEQFLKKTRVKIVYGQTYNLLNASHAAMVTSGTATLETALFGVPEVVCYQGNYLSYLLARLLIKVKYISLVNLIMDRLVVKELIQNDFNEKELKKELKSIISEREYRQKMLKNLNELAEKLGGQGASEKAASLMIHYLQSPA